jgi:type I restriction enzyme S subunit
MGPFGSSIKVSTFVSDGIPVISGQHLRGSRLNDIDYNFVTEAHADQLAKANVQRGDVILTHAGNIGQVAYIPNSSRYERYVISQRQFYIRCDPSKLIPEFLVYYFESHEGRHRLLANANQTGVPSLSQPVTYIRKVQIPLPPLKEQRAIADVLGALDDKIESNRRLAATIDGLLRVELENAILNDDDPREVRFGEIALRVGEASDPRNLREHVPYIGLEHMPRGNMFLDEWGTSEGLGSGKSVFKKGDVLFGRLRPYFKKVGVAPIDGICSTDVLVLKPAFNESAAMLLALAASEEFIGYASAAATGTKMPRVSWDYLSDWKTVLPSEAATNRFDNDMLPLVAKAVASVHEQVALAKLRDALLPELLSGRLRVKDAESMMESM